MPPETPVSRLAPIFAEGKVALVEKEGEIYGMVTKIDLIDHMASQLG